MDPSGVSRLTGRPPLGPPEKAPIHTSCPGDPTGYTILYPCAMPSFSPNSTICCAFCLPLPLVSVNGEPILFGTSPSSRAQVFSGGDHLWVLRTIQRNTSPSSYHPRHLRLPSHLASIPACRRTPRAMADSISCWEQARPRTHAWIGVLHAFSVFCISSFVFVRSGHILDILE